MFQIYLTLNTVDELCFVYVNFYAFKIISQVYNQTITDFRYFFGCTQVQIRQISMFAEVNNAFGEKYVVLSLNYRHEKWNKFVKRIYTACSVWCIPS